MIYHFNDNFRHKFPCVKNLVRKAFHQKLFKNTGVYILRIFGILLSELRRGRFSKHNIHIVSKKKGGRWREEQGCAWKRREYIQKFSTMLCLENHYQQIKR